MKKLIAILLAVMLLLPLGVMGVSALTPEEELEAQGRALVEETLAIFESKEFTLTGRDRRFGIDLPVMYMQDGTRAGIELIGWIQPSIQELGLNRVTEKIVGWAFQLLLGRKVRFVVSLEQFVFPLDQEMLIFPERRVWMDVTLLEGMSYYPSMLYTEARDLDLADLVISEPVINGKKYLCAEFETWDGIAEYYYLDGQLERIVGDDGFLYEVDSLSPTVDESYFSTKGMWKFPLDWLLKLGL